MWLLLSGINLNARKVIGKLVAHSKVPIFINEPAFRITDKTRVDQDILL
jgi:hypothetical protein